MSNRNEQLASAMSDILSSIRDGDPNDSGELKGLNLLVDLFKANPGLARQFFQNTLTDLAVPGLLNGPGMEVTWNNLSARSDSKSRRGKNLQRAYALMLDVEGLKTANAIVGNPKADKLLLKPLGEALVNSVGEVLSEELRITDTVGRPAGADEYLVFGALRNRVHEVGPLEFPRGIVLRTLVHVVQDPDFNELGFGEIGVVSRWNTIDPRSSFVDLKAAVDPKIGFQVGQNYRYEQLPAAVDGRGGSELHRVYANSPLAPTIIPAFAHVTSTNEGGCMAPFGSMAELAESLTSSDYDPRRVAGVLELDVADVPRPSIVNAA